MTVTAYLNEMKALLKDKLPQLEASLKEPATPAQLMQAEARLGVPFPQELRELYLLHNGEDSLGPGLFFGLRFLSLDELESEWSTWVGLEREYGEQGNHYSVPLGWIKERYINRGWLPLSEDGGGNHLGIDMAPDTGGSKGQVINFGRDEETKYVISRSLTDVLRFMRETVKEGNYSVFEEEEEWSVWAYGTEPGGHFLDQIRSLQLPLFTTIERSAPASDELQRAEQALDEKWQQLIAAKSKSFESFTQAKQLYLIREELTDITPLQYCTELRELSLSVNGIHDLSPLRSCQQLKVLYAGGNPVTDLTPLQALPHLQQLFLTGTGVQDIAPLAALPKLKELDLENTPVTDFSPLGNSKSLRSLTVSISTPGQLHALSRLNRLRKLEVISSGREMAADIQAAVYALGELRKLKELCLKGLTLSDVEFLKGCTSLERLVLEDTVVADLSALAKLPVLQELELNGSDQVGRLEDVAASSSLRKFTGSFAQFDLMKDKFSQPVDFSKLIGETTEEQSEIWRSYNR